VIPSLTSGALARLILSASFVLCWTIAPAEAQRPTGSVSIFLDYLPQQRDTVEMRSRVFVEEKVEPRPSLRITLSGFVEGLLARRPNPLSSGTTKATDAAARLHDATLEYTSRRVDVLVGHARVVWGRLDELQPTDVVNPLDASRFFFDGRSEARLPVTLVRARFFIGRDAAIEGVYVPDFRRGRFDQLDEATSPFNLAASVGRDLVACQAIGCPVLPIAAERREPHLAFRNSQGGIRLTATAGRVDWGVSAYRGLEPVGLFVGDESGVAPIEMFPRFTMFGADMESVFGDWGVRAEAAFFPEDNFQSLDLRPGKGRSFDIGAGIDRRAGGYTVSATALVHTESYDAPLLSTDGFENGRTDVSLIGSAERAFARERYRIRTFGVYNPAESSLFVRAILFISMRDNVGVEGSAGLFEGSGDDLIGRFDRNDFGYLRLIYRF
jgi:hypothetical protein